MCRKARIAPGILEPLFEVYLVLLQVLGVSRLLHLTIYIYIYMHIYIYIYRERERDTHIHIHIKADAHIIIIIIIMIIIVISRYIVICHATCNDQT